MLRELNPSRSLKILKGILFSQHHHTLTLSLYIPEKLVPLKINITVLWKLNVLSAGKACPVHLSVFLSTSASLFLSPPTPPFPPPFFSTYKAQCVCVTTTTSYYSTVNHTMNFNRASMLQSWHKYSTSPWWKTSSWSQHTCSIGMNHRGVNEMTEWCESVLECFSKKFLFLWERMTQWRLECTKY